MSILLSVYFREGIVFAADKNATLVYPSGITDVEVGKFTKVLAWPYRKAVVGWCGLGCLAGFPTDDRLRLFIAAHREFDDLDRLAEDLTASIQADFDKDHPSNPPPDGSGLIIHLGGYKLVDGHTVPAMYHIHNVSTDGKGGYGPPIRLFQRSEDVKREFDRWGPSDYPGRTRERLGEMLDQRDHSLWFNNGAGYPIFNVLKGYLWAGLSHLRKAGYLPAPSLASWDAYCRMAVNLYGSWYEEHHLPQHRAVGGGFDSVSIPWPNTPSTA